MKIMHKNHSKGRKGRTHPDILSIAEKASPVLYIDRLEFDANRWGGKFFEVGVERTAG